MANAYVMRTNMSVAIVAMVNHTAIGTDSDDTAEGVDEECGVDSTNSVSRDEKTPGAFVCIGHLTETVKTQNCFVLQG